MSLFTKKKILVTHDSTFHADELFATATLMLLLGKNNVKLVRTRDPKWFEKGDYVYDVGGEYDPSRNRFDHHQKGGAGSRENGIPYAAFGLVWKTYGAQVCESQEVADRIDKSLVQSIDAEDNGRDLYTVQGEIGPYPIQYLINTFRPSWKEEDFDKAFFEILEFILSFLKRKIKKSTDNAEAATFIQNGYDAAPDKRIIMLDAHYPWRQVLMDYPEPIYVGVHKSGKWSVYGVPKEESSHEVRKQFPESWAGLRDEELAKASGVPDAVFCHNGRFLAVAKSKEGAIALAEKALAM